MTNPLEWIAATSSHRAGSSDPGGLTLTTAAAWHDPLGRMGRPEEIANAVPWLVSPEASFVTGSDITVSGGL